MFFDWALASSSAETGLKVINTPDSINEKDLIAQLEQSILNYFEFFTFYRQLHTLSLEVLNTILVKKIQASKALEPQLCRIELEVLLNRRETLYAMLKAVSDELRVRNEPNWCSEVQSPFAERINEISKTLFELYFNCC